MLKTLWRRAGGGVIQVAVAGRHLPQARHCAGRHPADAPHLPLCRPLRAPGTPRSRYHPLVHVTDDTGLHATQDDRLAPLTCAYSAVPVLALAATQNMPARPAKKLTTRFGDHTMHSRHHLPITARRSWCCSPARCARSDRRSCGFRRWKAGRCWSRRSPWPRPCNSQAS